MVYIHLNIYLKYKLKLCVSLYSVRLVCSLYFENNAH